MKVMELELMSHIIAGQKKDDPAGKVNTSCGLEFFWNYLEKQSTDTSLIRKAILCFSDIIKHADVDIAVLYLDKLTSFND